MRKKISTTKVVLSALLLIPILLLVGCPSSCGETAQIRKNMTEGLEKIYGKEFVVARPNMTGNPGFGYHYEAKAYPKDNPDIKFTVAYDMNQKGDYGDDYLQILWSHQGAIDLRNLLVKQYGDDFTILHYSFRYNNKDYRNLNHAEVLRKCDGNPFIWLEYYIFTDSKIDKKAEAEKIYIVLNNFILRNRIKKYRLIVGYSPKHCKGKSDIYIRENTKSMKSFDELYKEKSLFNHIDIMSSEFKDAGIKKDYISELFKSFKY